MNDTVKYWLAANLGIVVWLLLLLIGVIVWLPDLDLVIHPETADLSEPDAWNLVYKLYVWSLSLGCGLIFCLPTKKKGESSGRYIFLIGFGLIWIFMPKAIGQTATVEEMLLAKRFARIYWIALATIHVPALLIARYCYSNFDEVVSRRMLYRNSSVSLFEEQGKYALSRFFDAVSAFAVVAALLLMSAFRQEVFEIIGLQ